ncbi:MAG: hypothetical protein E6451_10805 [Enterococcus faecalis]|nr:hypothetical protein [Enterococcus faecalis]
MARSADTAPVHRHEAAIQRGQYQHCPSGVAAQVPNGATSHRTATVGYSKDA